MRQALAGISTTYEAGDVLALTTNATYSLSSRVVARPLLAADKTAKYGGVAVVAAPTIPTIALATASTYGAIFLANGAYYVVITYVSATGESTASPQATVTTTGGTQSILVSPPAASTGAIGYRVYVSAIAGTGGPYYLQSPILSLAQQFVPSGTVSTGALIITGGNPPTVNTSGSIAGIAGVAEYSGITNTNGQWNAFTSPGGVQPGAVTLQLPGMGAAIPQDPVSNQGIVPYYAAVYGNEFAAALNGAVAGPAYNNLPCGLITSISGGITTYTLDPAPAAGFAIGVMSEADQTDPLYNTATNGGRMIFQFNQTYSQVINGINYSGQ
jgi:hypothetical protein